MSKIRVLIIHQDKRVRETLLKSMQEDTEGIEVLGCYEDTCNIMRDHKRRRLHPQVILCQGLAAEISSKCVPIEEIYPKAHMLHLGRRLTDSTLSNLNNEERRVATALQVTRVGDLPLSVESPDERTKALDFQPIPHISSRETQLIWFLRNGFTNKEIAGELNLSLQTVKNQLHQLFEKLRVRTRQQAIRSAPR